MSSEMYIVDQSMTTLQFVYKIPSAKEMTLHTGCTDTALTLPVYKGSWVRVQDCIRVTKDIDWFTCMKDMHITETVTSQMTTRSGLKNAGHHHRLQMSTCFLSLTSEWQMTSWKLDTKTRVIIHRGVGFILTSTCQLQFKFVRFVLQVSGIHRLNRIC